MKNPIIKWGLYYGLAAVAVSLIIFLIDKELLMGGWLGWVTGLGLPILFIVLLLKEIRTENEGYLGYGEAVKSGLMMFLLAALITTVFSYVLYNFIDPTLFELENQKALEAVAGTADMLGMDEEMKDEMIEQTRLEIEKRGDSKPATSFLLEYFMTIIIGLILSLIVGAFMKKSN